MKKLLSLLLAVTMIFAVTGSMSAIAEDAAAVTTPTQVITDLDCSVKESTLYIFLDATADTSIRISVIDVADVVHYTVSEYAYAGSNSYEIDMTPFASGEYSCTVTCTLQSYQSGYFMYTSNEEISNFLDTLNNAILNGNSDTVANVITESGLITVWNECTDDELRMEAAAILTNSGTANNLEAANLMVAISLYIAEFNQDKYYMLDLVSQYYYLDAFMGDSMYSDLYSRISDKAKDSLRPALSGQAFFNIDDFAKRIFNVTFMRGVCYASSTDEFCMLIKDYSYYYGIDTDRMDNLPYTLINQMYEEFYGMEFYDIDEFINYYYDTVHHLEDVFNSSGSGGGSSSGGGGGLMCTVVKSEATKEDIIAQSGISYNITGNGYEITSSSSYAFLRLNNRANYTNGYDYTNMPMTGIFMSFTFTPTPDTPSFFFNFLSESKAGSVKEVQTIRYANGTILAYNEIIGNYTSVTHLDMEQPHLIELYPDLLSDQFVIMIDGTEYVYPNFSEEGCFQQTVFRMLAPGNITFENPQFEIYASTAEKLAYYYNEEGGITVSEYLKGEPSVNIPADINGTAVTAIAANTFIGNPFSEIYLPSTITSIGANAFAECYPSTVYFEGTTEQWNSISIGDGNDSLFSANIVCNGDSSEEPVISYASCDVDVITATLTVNIETTAEASVTATIYDVDGNPYDSLTKYISDAGSLVFDLSSYPYGSYECEITYGNERIVMPFYYDILPIKYVTHTLNGNMLDVNITTNITEPKEAVIALMDVDFNILDSRDIILDPNAEYVETFDLSGYPANQVYICQVYCGNQTGHIEFVYVSDPAPTPGTFIEELNDAIANNDPASAKNLITDSGLYAVWMQSTDDLQTEAAEILVNSVRYVYEETAERTILSALYVAELNQGVNITDLSVIYDTFVYNDHNYINLWNNMTAEARSKLREKLSGRGYTIITQAESDVCDFALVIGACYAESFSEFRDIMNIFSNIYFISAFEGLDKITTRSQRKLYAECYMADFADLKEFKVYLDRAIERLYAEENSGSVGGGGSSGGGEETDAPFVYITDAVTREGRLVSVDVMLDNNTGFTNMGIEIGYDRNVMNLVNIETNDDVGASFTTAQSFGANPYNISIDSPSNTYFSGRLATLTFEISEYAEAGDYEITLDYYKGRYGDYIDGEDLNYNENDESINLTYAGGNVTVTRHNTGDIDDNEKLNNHDATMLLRYLAGWDIPEINEYSLDVNGDGFVDDNDGITLLRYLAGWDVSIY